MAAVVSKKAFPLLAIIVDRIELGLVHFCLRHIILSILSREDIFFIQHRELVMLIKSQHLLLELVF